MDVKAEGKVAEKTIELNQGWFELFSQVYGQYKSFRIHHNKSNGAVH